MEKDEFKIRKNSEVDWRGYRKGDWRAGISHENPVWKLYVWVFTDDGRAEWKWHVLPDGTTKRQAVAALRNFLRLGMDTGP